MLFDVALACKKRNKSHVRTTLNCFILKNGLKTPNIIRLCEKLRKFRISKSSKFGHLTEALIRHI